MSLLSVVLLVSLSRPGAEDPQGAPANPCRNGSFERLDPGGFPEGWAPLGRAEVSEDARTGERSLRLVRAGEPPSVETGLNGRAIEPLRGGVDFAYKAVSADGAALRIYAIPIGSSGIEDTGSPRAAFTVPRAHVGDGRWHRDRFAYDFTKNPAARSVIVAARIEGKAGELLLDDFAYLERAGPILRVGPIRLEEDPERPGSRARVCAPIENAGDETARSVRAGAAAPPGLVAEPAERELGDLSPGARVPAKWTLEGDRSGRGELRVSAAPAGAEGTEASLPLAPKLEIRSFGPVSPVAAVGEPIAVECVLANSGASAVLRPRALFAFGSEKASAAAESVLPGRSVALRASFRPRAEALAVPVSVRASGEGLDEPLSAASSLFVGPPVELPPSSGKLGARVAGASAILENEHLRLSFSRGASGFGPGRIDVRRASGWETAAWLPRLGRVVWRDARKVRRDETIFARRPPEASGGADGRASLRFAWAFGRGEDGGLRAGIAFELAAGAKTIAARYELEALEPAALLAFEGPMVYALEREEAIFPGLEWLVGDEVSSSALDIAEGHPDRVRYVVHPNCVTIPAVGVGSRRGTVGLLWNPLEKWDGRRDRPSAVFASPDRFENQRAHLAGLFLPSVPEFVERNAREARESTPYRLERGGKIALRAHIYADGEAADALAAAEAWMGIYGLPKPAPPPRGSYEGEIEFSMQAYLRSLWVPETKEWWTTKGGGIMSAKARPRSFVADLLVGALLSPDEGVRRQSRARAEEVLAAIGGEPRIDAQRFPGRLDLSLADSAGVQRLLAERDSRGAWRFDADQVGQGPFVGADYHELGPHDAVEVGTCAARATRVLRYARMTGDEKTFREVLPTLEAMESFRVPRAAQVWEVPVHAPDILAAAEAAEAFIEAYRFSGDARWLRDAVAWARRGLPFVYLWDDPERPYLLGASIPVFGATWMQGSWFGRPVQWNGLRYAEALFALSERDASRPWRDIATLVTLSAMRQQDADGQNVALWPDNVSAIDGEKCPWVFSPRMVIANALEILGRGEGIRTAILTRGGSRIHANACAKIAEASWDGETCAFRVAYPPGEEGVVVVFGLARPRAVRLDGEPVSERADVERGSAPGWRYEPSLAALSVRIARSGETAVRIEGAAPAAR